jgi:hypothetical protein
MGLLLKFIMLGVAAYAIWNTARRWLNVLGGDRVKAPPPGPPPVPPRAPAAPVQSVRRPVVEDTRACNACGAYVSLSGGKCGRPDCPQA